MVLESVPKAKPGSVALYVRFIPVAVHDWLAISCFEWAGRPSIILVVRFIETLAPESPSQIIENWTSVSRFKKKIF